MKTILIYFSDIHLTGEKPENEGAVIKAFCEDVKQQLMALQYNDAYVLIGGDLVQAADDTTSYQAFYDKILSKLITYGISNEKIICVPGNHDCQRQWVINHKETYAPVVNQKFSEDRFDNLINEQQGTIFTEKFANYKLFVDHYLPNSKHNLVGFSVEINEENQNNTNLIKRKSTINGTPNFPNYLIFQHKLLFHLLIRPFLFANLLFL